MKKIMFNEQFGLQQATFNRIKTMTRRVVPDKIMNDALAYQSHHIDDDRAYERYIIEHAPYKVGEIVAIAQRYVDIIGPDTTDEMFDCYSGAGCLNKMFVKAEYMPNHIQITGIRVQNLQDISDEDCLKEGIIYNEKAPAKFGFYVKPGIKKSYRTPREAFAALIDKTSGKGTWISNPIVYAYTYELID